jgi:hypothetical protein
VSIAALWLRGVSQRDMVAVLENRVCRATIAKDLAEIKKRWTVEMVSDADTVIACELHRIGAVESSFWKLFDGSEQSDSAALDGVLRCIAARCRLLGLDKPTKIAVTKPAGDKPWHPDLPEGVMTKDALLAFITAEVEKRHALKG